MSQPAGTPWARRVDALRAALDESGLGGAVLSRPEHVFYFTGTLPGPSPAFLIVLPQSTIAVAPTTVAGCETITYTDYDIYNGWDVGQGASLALSQVLSSQGRGKPLGVELAHLPALYGMAIREAAGELHDVADLLWRLRRIKDEQEIAQIEANVAGNDRVFRAVREALAPGMTEIGLWTLIYRTMCENAGGPITLEADVGAGMRASNPDVKPTAAAIAPDDAVLVDVYSATHGYYADTTRVFVLGEPSAKQRQIHDVLAAALAAGEAVLAPGILASEIDAAVRGVIERAGYGLHFPHHSGHAYGLFQQERPYLIPAETLPLEAGMVVTIEPGIYLPGWGGMRLEGSYVIAETGARRMDRFPSTLIAC
jgi:Xaa-Pro aminopeptidase